MSPPIPHRPPFSGPGGLSPGRSEDEPGEFFRNYGSGPNLPPAEQDEIDRQQRRPRPILSIFNIILSIVVIFILAVSILTVTFTTRTIDTSTSFRIYNETYDVTGAVSPGTGYNETITVTNPYIDQSPTLTDTPGAQPIMYQYNGTVWNTIAPAFITWNVLTPTAITIDKGALQT